MLGFEMKRRVAALPLLVCFAATMGNNAWAQQAVKMSFPQVLQQVVDHYPSLTVATLQVTQARQEVARVESTLGWSLTAQGGISRDVSSFGSTSDIADVTASLDRRLRSGNSVGVSGSYKYQDDAQVFSPTLPNPSNRTSLDLNYRMPFGRGNNNPDYRQGLVNAEAGTLQQQANYFAVRDQLARETLDLFYNAAQILARLETAQSAVKRAQRLKKYIGSRTELGVSERKDVLQAEAQYQSRLSDVRSLQITWQQTRTTLNRLMGFAWDRELSPQVDGSPKNKPFDADLETMVKQAQSNSAEILRDKARIKISEANIVLRRDSRKDKFDMVFSIGTRTSSGDTIDGQISDEDLAGGVRLEYQQALDKRGVDAVIYQAQLDKQIAEEDSRKDHDDLKYSVASLVAQIEANKIAVKSHIKWLKSEEDKFAEALKRYRESRAETDRLIQFENELQTAKFSLKDQKIAYEKRLYELTILRGKIWQSVNTNRDKE